MTFNPRINCVTKASVIAEIELSLDCFQYLEWSLNRLIRYSMILVQLSRNYLIRAVGCGLNRDTSL